MKSLTNKEWLQTILFPKHRPRIMDIGDQRDPLNVIICTCNPYPKRNDPSWPKDDAFSGWYQNHLVEVIEKDLPGIFNEITDTIYDGR